MRLSARTLVWAAGCAHLLGAALVVSSARGLGWSWRWTALGLAAAALLVSAALEALLASPLERLARRHPLPDGHPVRELASVSDWLTERAAAERARRRAERREARQGAQADEAATEGRTES